MSNTSWIQYIVYKHTHTYVHVCAMIILKEAMNLRESGKCRHGSSWRKEVGMSINTVHIEDIERKH